MKILNIMTIIIKVKILKWLTEDIKIKIITIKIIVIRIINIIIQISSNIIIEMGVIIDVYLYKILSWLKI